MSVEDHDQLNEAVQQATAGLREKLSQAAEDHADEIVGVYQRLMHSSNEAIALRAAQAFSEWRLGKPREADVEDEEHDFDPRIEAWIRRVWDTREREREAQNES